MATVKPDPVKCFSNRRLAEPIGNGPSQEAEANAMDVPGSFKGRAPSAVVGLVQEDIRSLGTEAWRLRP